MAVPSILSLLDALLDALASLAVRLELWNIVARLQAGEPRAWLIVLGLFAGAWAAFSLIESPRPRTTRHRRRDPGASATWGRTDGE